MASQQNHGDLDWPSPNETMSPDELNTVIVLERVGASASMIGVTLIFVTYIAFKRLRTVPNLFIAMASIANVGASVACLIGRDGVEQGEGSALCQAQAFMLEMFMQSDPWWSLAMAVNVFLVFFHGASTATFRQHLWVYAVVCYGAPLIPALALLFVRDEHRGAVYGDATLWCWIEPKWNALRIYTYYLPIWVCILFSAIIYAAVGTHVFRQRNQLRNLTFSNVGREQKDVWSSQNRDSAEQNLTSGHDYYGTAVTEVQITSSNQPWTPPTSPPRVYSHHNKHHHHHHHHNHNHNHNHHTRSIHGSAGPIASPRPAMVRPPRFSTDPLLAELDALTPLDDVINAKFPTSPSPSPPSPSGSTTNIRHSAAPSTASSSSSSSSASSNPPSPPRIHAHDKTQSSFQTTISSNQPQRRRSFLSRLPLWPRVLAFCSTFKHKYRRVDAVKKAYLRTSAIFALSVLFTWTPSSINRVYSLLHPETVSYSLTVASAFVLPLQGVWNAVIYFSTSWRPLCDEVDALRGKRKGLPLWKVESSTRVERADGSGLEGGGEGSGGGGGAGGRFERGGVGRTSEEESEIDLSTAPLKKPGGGEVRAIRGSF